LLKGTREIIYDQYKERRERDEKQIYLNILEHRKGVYA
jgi:hypothetical protein